MSLELAKQAVEEMRAEEKAEKLSAFEQKSHDWWTVRVKFQNYMFYEHADRGYDADKCHKASNLYTAARRAYFDTYAEDFDFAVRPIDVSEKCPESVDTSRRP